MKVILFWVIYLVGALLVVLGVVLLYVFVWFWEDLIQLITGNLAVYRDMVSRRIR